MSRSPVFTLSILGEGGEIRGRGMLGLLVPQALDLITGRSYTAVLAKHSAPLYSGSMHLIWDATTNSPRATYQRPGTNTDLPIPPWTQQVIDISTTLERTITWLDQT